MPDTPDANRVLAASLFFRRIIFAGMYQPAIRTPHPKRIAAIIRTDMQMKTMRPLRNPDKFLDPIDTPGILGRQKGLHTLRQDFPDHHIIKTVDRVQPDKQIPG